MKPADDALDGGTGAHAWIDPGFELVMREEHKNTEGWSWNGYEKKALFLAEPGDRYMNSSFLLGTAFEYDARNVVMADLDNDGELDLVTANTSSHTVSVLRGTGNGTFLTPHTFFAGTSPTGVAIGDVDGDGLVDLAVPCTNDYAVSILLGNGAGGFLRSAQHALGVRPNSVALGALDGDGDLDLLVSNPEVGYVSVLLNRSVP